MLLIIIALLIITYIIFSTHYVKINNIQLYGSNTKLKIAHISDIHGKLRFLNGGLSEILNEKSLDYLIVTGDLANDYEQRRLVREELNRVNVHYKILIILGNYERIKYKLPNNTVSFQTSANIIKYFNNEKIQVLVNEAYIHEHNNNKILFWGFDNSLYGREKYNKELEDKQFTYRILLAHSPNILEFVKHNNISGDLLLIGHTHGNQINIPLIKNIKNPYTRYHIGLKYVNRMQVNISRGLGTSRVPIRINSRPEITIFELS